MPRARSQSSSVTACGAPDRGTRKLQLQLLAAATALNLERLLAHEDAQHASGAHGTRSDAVRPRDATTTGARLLIATRLLALLTATLDEIGRLSAADTSTAS